MTTADIKFSTNESDDLKIKLALKKPKSVNIVAGKIRTGKTATMKKIRDYLISQKRYVVVISDNLEDWDETDTEYALNKPYGINPTLTLSNIQFDGDRGEAAFNDEEDYLDITHLVYSYFEENETTVIIDSSSVLARKLAHSFISNGYSVIVQLHTYAYAQREGLKLLQESPERGNIEHMIDLVLNLPRGNGWGNIEVIEYKDFKENTLQRNHS